MDEYGGAAGQSLPTMPGVGSMSEPSKPSAIARLNSAREYLHQTVDELEKALAPILGFDEESAKVSEVPERQDAQTYLHESASSVEAAIRRLQSIGRRLELN